MSAWAPCPLCGHERENLCACVNPKCSDYVTPVPPQVAPEDELEFLRRWRHEQLTVTAWWQAVDDYIRKSPDAPLGENVSAIALKWLQQRRGILETIEALETVLGTWRADLATIPDHLPFGSDSRAKIAAIIKQIEELLPPSP